MKIIEYTTKKIILNSEEKLIKNSWKNHWKDFVKSYNKGEKIEIIIGEWSGYTSAQRKVCHIDFADRYLKSNKLTCKHIFFSSFYGKIEFSDATYLEVYVKSYSLEDILREKIYPKISYHSLIKQMIDSGEKYLKV